MGKRFCFAVTGKMVAGLDCFQQERRSLALKVLVKGTLCNLEGILNLKLNIKIQGANALKYYKEVRTINGTGKV